VQRDEAGSTGGDQGRGFPLRGRNREDSQSLRSPKEGTGKTDKDPNNTNGLKRNRGQNYTRATVQRLIRSDLEHVTCRSMGACQPETENRLRDTHNNNPEEGGREEKGVRVFECVTFSKSGTIPQEQNKKGGENNEGGTLRKIIHHRFLVRNSGAHGKMQFRLLLSLGARRKTRKR